MKIVSILLLSVLSLTGLAMEEDQGPGIGAYIGQGVINTVTGVMGTAAIAYPLYKCMPSNIATFVEKIPDKIVPSIFKKNKRLFASVVVGTAVWHAVQYILCGGIEKLQWTGIHGHYLGAEYTGSVRFTDGESGGDTILSIPDDNNNGPYYMSYFPSEAKALYEFYEEGQPSNQRWFVHMLKKNLCWYPSDFFRTLLFSATFFGLNYFGKEMNRRALIKSVGKSAVIALVANTLYKKVYYPYTDMITQLWINS